MLKGNRGITLIALIITIIVMLILVAVSVTVAINGGLFNKTKQAAEEMEIGAEKDILSAAALMAYNHETDSIDLEVLKTSLEVEGWTVETENGETVYISSSNRKYKVGPNFEVAYAGENVEESVKYLEDDNDPLTIGSIEDLVDLSIAVNEGTTYEGETITLLTSLDFDNPESYRNSEDTSYGDINGNGTDETIITELTTGLGFKPIGSIDLQTGESKSFVGIFDGNGKTISNLYINRPQDLAALFVGLSGKATVKNLTLKNLENYGIYSCGIAISYDFTSLESDVLTISNCHTIKGRLGGVNEKCVSQYSSGLICAITMGKVDIIGCSNSSTLSGMASSGIAYVMSGGKITIKECQNYGEAIIENADIYIAAEKDASDVGTAGCAIAVSQKGVEIKKCFNYATLNETAGGDIAGLVVGSGVSVLDSSNYGILNYSGKNDVDIAGIYIDPDYGVDGILCKAERCNNYGDINAVCVNVTTCEIAGITLGNLNTVVSECINKGNINISGSLNYSSSNRFYVAGIDLNSYIINNCINYGEINENVESRFSSKCISGVSIAGMNNINCANYGNLNGAVVASIAMPKISSATCNVDNCYNVGNVTAYNPSSGNGKNAYIENSYNLGTVIGGDAGFGNGTSVKNCHLLTGKETAEEKQGVLSELNNQVAIYNEELEASMSKEPQLAELIGEYLVFSEWKIDPNINNGYPVFSWQQAEQ